eukprot:2459175-Prorocentrum_lima.AAC.1
MRGGGCDAAADRETHICKGMPGISLRLPCYCAYNTPRPPLGFPVSCPPLFPLAVPPLFRGHQRRRCHSKPQ